MRDWGDSIGALLAGGRQPPSPVAASPQSRAKAQSAAAYAAELRAQIAAKEERRQRERAASLRQSTALLELRQGAASDVLPTAAISGRRASTVSLAPTPARRLFEHGPQSGAQLAGSAFNASMPAADAHAWQPQPATDGWAEPPPPPAWSLQQAAPSHTQAAGTWHWDAAEPLPQALPPHAPTASAAMPHPLAPAYQQQSAPEWGLPPQHEARQQQRALEPQPLDGWLDGGAASMAPSHMPAAGYSHHHARDAGGLSPARGFEPGSGGLQRMQSSLQPPYGTEQPSGPGAAGLPPPQWHPAVAAAPFGNDLQPPLGPPVRTRSLRPAPPGTHAAGALPPWAAPQQQPPRPLAAAGPGASPGRSPGRLADIGGEAEGAAARAAQERKRAAYKAELERQMALKEQRLRQERERERADEERQAREAQALARRAAAGGYGGGSGPLRDAEGHIVADLNEVRRYKEKAAASSQPGSPSGGGAGIPAHWGSAGGVAGSTAPGSQPWLSGMEDASASAGMMPPAPMPLLAQQPSLGSSWTDQLAPAAAMQQPSWQLDGPAGWQEEQPPAAAMPASLTLSHGPQPPQPAPIPAAGPGVLRASPTKGAGQPPSALMAPAPTQLPMPGGGGEAVSIRLRSDRPFQTASEAERRARAQAEFKEALRQQVEEKARLKAEEQRRRQAEEAEEEARLAREQERLRQQFAADQSRQRAKKADKEGSAETLESDGVTIKFKPPPAGRSAASRPPPAPAALDPDDAVPGVEIRVGRRPPPPAAAAAARDAAPQVLPAGASRRPSASEQQEAPGVRASLARQASGGLPLSGLGPPLAQQQQQQQQQPPAGMMPPQPLQQGGMLPTLPLGQAAAAGPAMAPPWGMAQLQMQAPPYTASQPGWGASIPLPQQQAFAPAQPMMAPAGFSPASFGPAGFGPAGPPYLPWGGPASMPGPLPAAQLPPWMQQLPQTAAFGGAPPPAAPWLQPPLSGGPFGVPPPAAFAGPSPPAALPPFPMPPLGVPLGPPTVAVLPPNRPFGGRVFETSGVLSLRDSNTRPPTAKGVGLPPLQPAAQSAPQHRLSGATLAARCASFALDRDGPAPSEPSMPGRSTLLYPPLPPAAGAEGPAARRSSSAGRRASLPAAVGGGPDGLSAAAGEPPPSRGLRQWDSLGGRHGVPFSRQSSPTPPLSEQQEVPGTAPGGGRAGQRRSWAGAAGEGASSWPS